VIGETLTQTPINQTWAEVRRQEAQQRTARKATAAGAGARAAVSSQAQVEARVKKEVKAQPRSSLNAVSSDELVDIFGLPEEASWQERALCSQTDPEAFHPEKGGSTREAKKICTGCEVRLECLEYALKHNERFGIWGGLSERERRRLKKRAI